MRLIISPAKKMRHADGLPCLGTPAFLGRAESIKSYLQTLTPEQLRTLWQCNDRLAQLNYDRVLHMNLTGLTTPAILAYEGIQYQYMAPGVMEQQALDWLQQHLRILSGFYGILRPFDGIVPYRLEMQARATVAGTRNLYHFWGDTLYKALTRDGNRVIINLASREYSQCITPYLQPEDRFITVIFGQLQKGRVVQKGTLAKMARGEMVRFLAERQACSPDALPAFDRLNFCFDPVRSTDDTLVFLQNPTGNHS